MTDDSRARTRPPHVAGLLLPFLWLFACTNEQAPDDASRNDTERPRPSAASDSTAASPIPVIFDTDLGTDIDDTWALAQLLASPELDLRLVVTDSGDTETRARLIAKFLEAAGRTDVPIGIGVPEPDAENLPIGQAPWADDYDLENYPGTVHRDGIAALIDTVLASEEQMTLLAVGPVPNLVVALEREPSLAERVRVVADERQRRPGLRRRRRALRRVQRGRPSARGTAPLQRWMGPTDRAPRHRRAATDLRESYQRLVRSESRTVQALLESYRVWEPTFEWGDFDVTKESSVLFDALAVLSPTTSLSAPSRPFRSP